MPLKIKVLKCAAVSRLIVFAMQVTFNALIVDHDAGVFRKPKPLAENNLERFFEFILDGLERWDGQYFLNVAEYGYVYEKSLAFFPLFPLLTRLLANSVLFPLQYFVNYHLVLLLAAVGLNFVCFVSAALLLFLLGKEILNSEQWAFKAALLFCYNPASIFFSAVYSESLFSCSVFAGMLLMEKDIQFGATAAFALSTLVRSNGTVNAGFLLYSGAILPLILVKTRKTSLSIATCSSLVFFSLIRSLVVIGSFALFQLYAYEVFCVWPRPNLPESVLKLSAQDPTEYVVPGEGTAWCHSLIPVSYGYVQSHYWNVGFFRYFELKQIPNFLLAFPAIALCLHGIFRYAIRLLNSFAQESSSPAFERHLRILPYVVHCSFLLVFGITSMHIQVVTRLVTCSSPFLCLFAAAILPDLPQWERRGSNCSEDRQRKKNQTSIRDVIYDNIPLASYWTRRKHLKTRSKMVLVYFMLYYVIGTVFFANYLPWT